MKIVNYFEVSANFNLKPAEAVAFFQAKGLKPTFAWQDMLGDEHDTAFTVAKMMDTDLLHTVKAKLDNALESGQSLGAFKKELMPLLQKAGWWGKKDVIDPLTGLVSKAQLGSASRLETIFRTNLQSAYAVGQWQQIADQAASAPFLMYDAVDDTRTRPEHKAHDNLVLPVSSSWWEQYMPPNGWNCRCGVIQLDGDELNDHGLKVGTPPPISTHAWKNPRTGVTHYVPDDLDPGWDHNPGKARQKRLDTLAAQKVSQAAISEQHALAAAVKQKAKAIAAAKAKIAADDALAELNQAKAAAAQIAKAEVAAQAAIDKALAEKTPYLAQAITKTLKTKAGPNYTATELLAIAEAKVPTIKQSSLLSSYKQNKAKGKTPNAAQQEAYDLLPEAAQASIDADIDIKSGKSQALADLKAIAEGKTNPIEANLFKQYSLDGTASGFGDDLPGLVSKIKAEAAIELKAADAITDALVEKTPYLAQAITKISKTKAGQGMDAQTLLAAAKAKAPQIKQQSLVASYKKAIKSGKTPTPEQAGAFKALPEADQATLLESLKASEVSQVDAIALISNDDDLSMYYLNDVMGNPIEPQQLAAWEKLNPAQKAAVQDIIDKEKAPAGAPAAVEAPAGFDGFTADEVEAALAVANNKGAPDPQIAVTTLLEGHKNQVTLTNLVQKLTGEFNGNPTAPQAKKYGLLSKADQGKIDALVIAKGNQAQLIQFKTANKLGAVTDEPPGVPGNPYLDLDNNALHTKLDAAMAKADATKYNNDLLPNHVSSKWLDDIMVEILDEDFHPDSLSNAHVKAWKATEPDTQHLVEAALVQAGKKQQIDDFIAKAAAFGTEANKPKVAPPKPKPKPAPAPEPEPESAPSGPPTMDQLTQIGGQGGSNKGGLYQEIDTGIKWYVKEPQNADMANNEVLTGKLYEAAGIEVPEMHIGVEGGTTRIFSKIIDGLDSDASALKAGKVAGVNDAFVVDAWLANWDVVGLGYDNLMVKAGRAIRIDTGAGLRYRAQGGSKNSNWNDLVGELDSLRDSGLNPQAAAVYKHVTDADMIAGARKVLSIDQDAIEALVYKYGPEDAAGKQALVDTLLARQAAIAKRFPAARAKPKPAPKIDLGGARVSQIELTDIEDSRINGISIATDKDQIEDQNVLLWHKTIAEGEPVTGGYFKVRGEAEKRLRKTLGDVASETINDYNDVNEKIIAGIKSLYYRIDKGENWDSGSLGKVKVAVDRYDEVVGLMTAEVKAKRRPQKQLDDFIANAELYIAQLRRARIAVPGDTPKAGEFAQNLPHFTPKAIAHAASEKKKKQGIQWTRRNSRYNLAKLDNGRATELTDSFGLDGYYYEATIDGARVKYHPIVEDTLFALQGRVEIDVPGQSQADAARIFDTMDALGVSSARATAEDVEDLYLRKMAYIEKIDGDYDAKTQGMTIEQRRAWIEQRLGTKALLSNPHYQPGGELQAFSHGRRLQYNPAVLNDPAWPKFEQDYRLFHNFTDGNMVETLDRILHGGGQMAPSTDKVRRGIPLGGMSPMADMRSGGGSYFFTRIKTKSSAYSNSGSLVWKVKPAARMDAISYDGDKYGRVSSSDYVQSNRHVGIAQMKKASRQGGNETIFKDSLSIFDDLDRIQVNSKTQQNAVIKVFQKHGHQKWPDGRELSEVIVVV